MVSVDDRQQFREQQFARDALTKYRHNAADLHLIGETIGPPSRINQTGNLLTSSLGTSPYPAREDHVHGYVDDNSTFGVTITPAITLGTPGQINSCRWTMLAPKVVYVSFSVQFGTGGGTPTAGNWTLTMPNGWQIAEQIPTSMAGLFRAVDASAGNLQTYGQALTAATPSSTFLIRSITAPNTASNTWGQLQPFGVQWAVGDSFSGGFVVRIV